MTSPGWAVPRLKASEMPITGCTRNSSTDTLSSVTASACSPRMAPDSGDRTWGDGGDGRYSLTSSATRAHSHLGPALHRQPGIPRGPVWGPMHLKPQQAPEPCPRAMVPPAPLHLPLMHAGAARPPTLLTSMAVTPGSRPTSTGPPSSEATRGSCTWACGNTRSVTSSSQSGPSRFSRCLPSCVCAAKGARTRTLAR